MDKAVVNWVMNGSSQLAIWTGHRIVGHINDSGIGTVLIYDEKGRQVCGHIYRDCARIELTIDPETRATT